MITITIEGHDAAHARREMLALLGDQPARAEGAYRHQEVVVDLGAVSDEIAETIDGRYDITEAQIEAETAPEQPRRGRGRPRKNPPTIDGESTLVSETVTPAPQSEPEQIDLEEVIAKQSGAEMAAALPDDTEPEGNILAGKMAEAGVEQSQPADPEKGWTHDDAKAVARQMYVRLGSLQQHELNERLHKNLQAFGVQRIKDLPAEKIEAFIRGVEGEQA